MISSFEAVEALLGELDRVLQRKVHLFMIGGAALLHQGVREETKDIDIIVFTGEEFRELTRRLKAIGFRSRFPGRVYKRMDLSEILLREDFRIDLFREKVCGQFSLSRSMAKRAKKVYRGKDLMLSLCSNEDIFLFKSMTERMGDVEDCIALAQRGLDWDIILKELESQIKESGEDVWITWVGERFDLLQEKGLNIPVMQAVNELRNRWYEERAGVASNGK